MRPCSYPYLFTCLFSHIYRVSLVVFIAYILTDSCIITSIHTFSSSAASVINKFSVQCSNHYKKYIGVIHATISTVIHLMVTNNNQTSHHTWTLGGDAMVLANHALTTTVTTMTMNNNHKSSTINISLLNIHYKNMNNY